MVTSFPCPQRQRVRGELAEAKEKKATTVAEFLKNPKLHDPVWKAVLWVSDAHRLSINSLIELVEFAKANRSRVVLSGDKLSRGAVYRGNPLDVLEKHAGVQPHVIREALRTE